MSNLRLNQINEQIRKIKKELILIGEMRPGSLSKQNRGEKEGQYGSYCHLSYTHKGIGHTEYIRRFNITDIRKQVENYKLFKRLNDRWISLAIKHSQIKMKMVDK